MSLQINTLSSTLKNITNNIDFSSVQKASDEAISKFESIKKTTLGSVIGEIKGGIESLTKEIDDAQSALTSNIIPTITRATSNVPGIADKLVGKVGSAAADIQALTGKAESAADGFLKDIVSAASPEAIDTALKKAAGATTTEIENALKAVGDIDLGSFIEQGLASSPFGDFLTQIDTFTKQIETTIGANSRLFLVDFGEKLEKNFENSVNSIIGQVINQNDIAKAFSFVAGGDVDAGFGIIEKYISLPENYYTITDILPENEWPADVIEAYDRMNTAKGEFTTLNVELSSYVNQFDPAGGAAGRNTQTIKRIGAGPSQTADSINTPYQGRTSDGDIYDFSDIKSAEELESLFRSISRPTGKEIAGAIIHWSANTLDQNHGAAEIHAGHIAKGWANGCGYHIIIRRDGTLQRGRPMNISGVHDENNNMFFLGFCFIGGVNTTYRELTESGKKNYHFASAESFTREQWNSYDQLMRTFHLVFPYAQVAGHYETSKEGQVDPGFDVPGYSLSKFNHKNVVPEGDTLWKGPNLISLSKLRELSGGI